MAVELIATIKPKNNGSFPVVEAEDIAIDENDNRLPSVIPKLYHDGSFVPTLILSQSQYDALVEDPEFDENICYLVYEDDSGGTEGSAVQT